VFELPAVLPEDADLSALLKDDPGSARLPEFWSKPETSDLPVLPRVAEVDLPVIFFSVFVLLVWPEVIAELPYSPAP